MVNGGVRVGRLCVGASDSGPNDFNCIVQAQQHAHRTKTKIKSIEIDCGRRKIVVRRIEDRTEIKINIPSNFEK